MTERKLKPHIRFKGFENNWKKVKMSQLVDERSENVVPDNQYPLMAFIAEKGVSDKGEKYNRDFLVKSEKKKYKKTEYGDLIYSSNNLEVGSIGINNYGNATISPVYSIFKVNKLMTYTFLGYLVQRKSFINNMIKYRQGVTYGQWKIHESDFLRLQEIIPNSKEQQKIGDLFAKLDRLLDMQQQKLDQLELLKKALLQKLFPKQGTEIPELRFKGFEDEWKQEQFSYLYKKRSEKNDLTFGPDRIISVANMYFKQTETRSDEKYMKTYNVFRLGDIAFEGNKSKRFSFGRFVENTVGDGIVSHVFEVFRPITSYDLNYWKYAIHNENFMGPILRRSTIKATMMNNLIEKDFLKQKVSVPKLSEQQKIGNLIAKIDRLIELENKKFSSLKQIKKSLLQNMFVE